MLSWPATGYTEHLTIVGVRMGPSSRTTAWLRRFDHLSGDRDRRLLLIDASDRQGRWHQRKDLQMSAVNERILITGAGGGMGRLLRPRLAAEARTLRLLDVADVAPPTDGEQVETVTGSVSDLDAMLAACEGVDAIIHLGGISVEAPFDEILETNVKGTYCLLEAAHRQGVQRVVLASSNHAVGYASRDGAPPDGLPADLLPRPDSYYGWSKAANESLGSLYADTYGMDVFCVRIGSCFPEPTDLRGLTSWMSPDDAAALMETCLRTTVGGFQLLWGISDNTRKWWSLGAGEKVGYHPRDDAEVFADGLIGDFGEPDLDDPIHHLVGGKFCAVPLGERMS
jgi:NAD(P)-dependent dehydrogenase (short-subunit alcohol dehydrogenase family)